MQWCKLNKLSWALNGGISVWQAFFATVCFEVSFVRLLKSRFGKYSDLSTTYTDIGIFLGICEYYLACLTI
jgi:hypothetical protein